MATTRKLPNVITDAIYTSNKYLKPVTLTGTTDLDISEAVYTGYIAILTVEAVSEIRDLVLDFDLDKETTGVNDVATNNDTTSLLLQVSIDGTLFTGVEASASYTLTGTFGSIATGVTGKRFIVGSLPTGAKVKVLIKLSAERADAEIPYAVTYTSEDAPTVTAVAAA
jgi:hypothetical protein